MRYLSIEKSNRYRRKNKEIWARPRIFANRVMAIRAVIDKENIYKITKVRWADPENKTIVAANSKIICYKFFYLHNLLK